MYSSRESSAVRSEARDEATEALLVLQVICCVLALSSRSDESRTTSRSPFLTCSPSGTSQMIVVPPLLSTWQVTSTFLALWAFPFPTISWTKVPRVTFE